MNEDRNSNPVPDIRAVFLAGFFSGDVFGLFYLGITGHLLDVSLNPLASVGAFLGVGLVGMMIGGVCGLSMRLLLGEQKGWHVPIVISGVASAVTGLLIANMIVAW